jgi:hypothetical protein
MRAKGWILLVAAAALLLGAATAASAAEKPGKPFDSKPSASAKHSDDWRARALRARAEFAPDGESLRGNTRAVDERGDRNDGEEVGSGRLRQDRGEGGGKEQ